MLGPEQEKATMEIGQSTAKDLLNQLSRKAMPLLILEDLASGGPGSPHHRSITLDVLDRVLHYVVLELDAQRARLQKVRRGEMSPEEAWR